MNPLAIVTTMAKRGMLAPMLPHRLAGQLTSLATWGMSLVGEVRQASIASPNAIAVIDEDSETTYAELFRRSLRTAAALRELGVAPGDRIGLLARNHAGGVDLHWGDHGVDLAQRQGFALSFCCRFRSGLRSVCLRFSYWCSYN